MAAQVEVQTGEAGRTVAGGRLHLSPLTDSSNKNLIEIPPINQSHIITPEPNKPLPNPKPRLTPKPFVVEKNPTIKPILAPKPQTKPRPESTRLAGYKPELPCSSKPQQPVAITKHRPVSTNPNRPASTTFKASNKLNSGQTTKPVIQPFKPAPSIDPGDPSKPTPPVPVERQKTGPKSLAYSKSLKKLPVAEWSGTTIKEGEKDRMKSTKGGTSITRAKSMGCLVQAGQKEEEEEREKVKYVAAPPLRPQPRTPRPRPVSAIFLDSPTKTETPVPAPRWGGRRPLSADLTSKFESIGLSLHRKTPKANTKENTPEEKALPQTRDQEKTTPQNPDGEVRPEVLEQSENKAEETTVKEHDENEHAVSIKSRISLLLDSSSPPGAGSDLNSPLQVVPESEPPVGVKQLIKQLTEDTTPTQSAVVKPALKPRPLPLDLTKRFSSERSPDHGSVSFKEATDRHEISKDPQMRSEESAFTPSDQRTFVDLTDPQEQLKKASTPDGAQAGVTSKESGPTSDVQTVRASLFENVVERHSVVMVDEAKPVNKSNDSLSSPSIKIGSSEDEGALVTATYKEPVAPSSRLRVVHAFDTVQAVEENRAVSETVPLAQWEDKAMTLRSRRSAQGEPASAVTAEQHPRYLRVGALQKWTTTDFDQHTGLEKGTIMEPLREVSLEKDRDKQKEPGQEEVAATQKPKATYFALTAQMQEPISPVDAEAKKGSMNSPFDNFSVRSVLGVSQVKINPVRRNSSVDEAYAKTFQVEELMVRSHTSLKEIKSVSDGQMREEMMEVEKNKEIKLETERHVAKIKEHEKEKQRQLELEKHAHLEFARMKERDMQREFERQRQKDFEKEKQEFEVKQHVLEMQKQIELENHRLQELERERLQIERDKQLELERQIEIKREKLQEQERQRQREEERQRELDKQRHLLELQREMEDLERQQLLKFHKERQEEKERQQVIEFEKQRLKEKKEREEAEKMKQMALEQEILRLKQIDKEREKLKEMERQKEREKQRELERQRQKEELERERQRELDIKRQELENQRLRQLELEKERQKELEQEKLRELKRQDLERERQKQLDIKRQELENQRLRQLELEKERQKELEQEKLRELKRQDLERERQKQLDIKRQELENQMLRQLELEKEHQKELEQEKLRELKRQDLERERQKQLDIKRQELENQRLRQLELEKERQKELELERLKELERQKQQDLERERQKQLDIKRQELENQRLRQQELDKERQKELEQERLKELERQKQQHLERERQKQLDIKRQESDLERERQKQLEIKRQELEMQRLRQQELEKERQKEKEHQQELEWEKQRALERQRQQELERERERQLDIKRQELENQRLRQLELEKERQKELEQKKLRELERQRQQANQRLRQQELEKERRRKEELEIERRRLMEFEKQGQSERERQQILEKMEKEEAEKMRQIAKQQEAERRRLKNEQERARSASSPLRPKVVDLDSVLRNDPLSMDSSQRSDLSTRWKEPSPRAEESYKPPILDIDSFTIQTQLSLNKDLFPVSSIQGVDTGFGTRLQPTPERDVCWKVPPQIPVGLSSPEWKLSPQDPWELWPNEMSVDNPKAEHNKHANKLSPEQLLLKQEEQQMAPQRQWSAVLGETLQLAPFPQTKTNNPSSADSSIASTEPIWFPREPQRQDSKAEVHRPRRSQGSQELNRMRSRSVSRRSAPSSGAVEGSLMRIRSRSAHREQDRHSWVQQKQSVRDEEEGKASETPVHDTDSQYGTWETGLHTDDSLTPATPSSESNLSPSPRKSTSPHTPSDHGSQFETDTTDSLPSSSSSENQPLSFPDAPTTLLDTSVLRSRAQLGKKRTPRTRPTRAARQSAALPEGEGATTEDWFYRDSTEAKVECKEDNSDSEEQNKAADPSPAVASQPQRVALFPGVDPSALKAQLKKRGDSDNQIDGPTPSPSQPSRSPKSPFLPRAARVLPIPGGKENGEEDSPQWLKELKSKKRLSQYETES